MDPVDAPKKRENRYGADVKQLDPRLAKLILAVAVCVVYLPLLGGGFVWDDHLLILQNQLTDSFSNIPKMFQTDLWGATPIADEKTGYYRPLMLVDLTLSRSVAGLEPWVYHLHNLLWHCASIFFLLKLLQSVVQDSLAAVLGTAIFALHPTQLEAVGFISARNDPMAVTWLLIALNLLSRQRPSTMALLGGALAACAAMLCKESVVFAPILLAFACHARWGRWGSWRAHLSVLGGFGIALLMRMNAGVGVPEQAEWSRLETVGLPSLAFYLDKLLVPFDIAPVIHFGWLPAVPWATAGLAIVLLVWIGKVGGSSARAGIAFAFLGLLPAWAAVAHVGAVVDRYLYLPMVGIGWAVAVVARRPGGRRIAQLAAVAFVVLSVRQAPVWKNDASVWMASIERAPSGYAKGALAKWLDDQGMSKAAAHWYLEAVSQDPMPFEHSCFNLSRSHLKAHGPAAAIEATQKGLVHGCERSAELMAPYALAYALEGQWEQALAMAQEVSPDPTGKAVIAKLAAKTQLGDIQALQDAIESADKGQGADLRRQVLKVLDHAGADVDSVTSVLDASGGAEAE
ncbi:MAG: hypothetical protein CL930_16805 [Deltaproteobacteria bacterium]|nr:hypothetical protein [Deltaproteobacteria bacterium]